MPREIREFTVSWTINVDSHSARGAAQVALAMQRDPTSEASSFTVIDHGAMSDPNIVNRPYESEIDLTMDEDTDDGLIEPCPFCGYLQCSEHMELRERI